MKILIYDEQQNTQAHGGASIFALNFYSFLKNKFEAVIFSDFPTSTLYRFFVGLPYVREIFIYPLLFLIKSRKISEFNVLILNSTFSHFLTFKNANYKTISIVHALFYLQIKNILPLYKKNILLYLGLVILFPICKLMERKSLLKSDFIVCPKKDLESILRKDLKEYCGEILVIPQFANENIFFQDQKITKDIDVLFIGRGTKAKGFHDLIQLIDRRTDLKFTVIGRKIEENIFKSKTNVTFYKNIPHTDLAEYYNKSKILFMPSYSETGPLVTIESLMCGTPVIGSKNGCGEFVRDGMNGFSYVKFSLDKFNLYYDLINSNYKLFAVDAINHSNNYKERVILDKYEKILDGINACE